MGCSQSKSIPDVALPETTPIKEKAPSRRVQERYMNKTFQTPTTECSDFTVKKHIGDGSISSVSMVTRMVPVMQSPVGSLPARSRAGEDPTETEESTEADEYMERSFALKEIDLEKIDEDKFGEMKSEIEKLSKLDHPNIAKIHQVYQEDETHIAVLMDLCTGGDVTKRGQYPEEEARRIIAKIVEAVNYLHENNIAHTDLKAENILFESDSPNAEVKLIDFGLARRFKKGDTLADRLGPVFTMSPEQIRGENTQASDMWAVGVIAYQLLSGDAPFWGQTPEEIKLKVLKQEYSFNGVKWQNISKEAKAFIRKCLQVEQKLRYTAPQSIKAPWMVDLTIVAQSKIKQEHVRNLLANGKSLRSVNDSEFRQIAVQAVARNATPDEIKQLHAVFHALDEDKDGEITFDELKQGLVSHYGETEIQRWFECIDVDGDGVVNYLDFLTATIDLQSLLQRDKILEAFRIFDKNGKGYITRGNLRSVLGKGNNEYVEHYIERLIGEADSNRDGLISFNEFEDVILNYQQESKAMLKGEGTEQK